MNFKPLVAEFVGTFALIFVGAIAVGLGLVGNRTCTRTYDCRDGERDCRHQRWPPQPGGDCWRMGPEENPDRDRAGVHRGAATNPARHLGPALLGGGLENCWIYWVGSRVGGIAAGLLCRSVPESKQTPVVFLVDRILNPGCRRDLFLRDSLSKPQHTSKNRVYSGSCSGVVILPLTTFRCLVFEEPAFMKKKIVITSGVAVVVLVGAFFIFGGSKKSEEDALPRIKVARGNIVDKALAVGTIEPEQEISVKSKVSGAVNRIFADAGTYVKAGDPLLEVRPDPTPLELVEAKRNMELAQVELENMKKDRVRQESMIKKQLISTKEFEEFQRQYDQTVLKLDINRERLALLEQGHVKIGSTNIESIVKAPIDGYVLKKTVEVGDPVTPLTSYQEGTVLMKMANMERLLFKGTVDEIDVGKLKEGMEAELKVGALPTDKIVGRLAKISLKAEKKDNATIFPIEVLIPKSKNSTLRAGYSANASIIIQKKDSVLMIPERTITFRNDSAFVKVALGPGKQEDRLIKTGLSDAINIEVLEGLKEGDEVIEKPVKKIE